MLKKRIFLQLIDQNWTTHIQYLEQLRQVIGLRSYGQKDPLSEFKKEAFTLFEILLEKIKCRGTALDVSKKAIKVSKINAKMQHIENRIKFIHSDIDKLIVGKYDLIVTNPPYIKADDPYR